MVQDVVAGCDPGLLRTFGDKDEHVDYSQKLLPVLSFMQLCRVQFWLSRARKGHAFSDYSPWSDRAKVHGE